MLELFSAETTIVLGLELSDEEDKLVQSTVSLARKTGARLVLVHAIQPMRTYTTAGDDMTLPYEAFEADLYQSDSMDSEQKLQAIRDRLPPEMVIDIEIVRDYPENALDHVAQDVRAALIVCGMRTNQPGEWYGGMSTALSLMNSSTFPVMVIPLTTTLDFATRDHNILVADNLREEGLYA
ncbi:MAG: universal stress protein, partial [Proteobacteria bacterium]